MKRGFRIILFVMVLGLMVGLRLPVKAQCAQCAAAVETNSKEGGKAANGLNKGILFLLGAPYMAVAAVGYIWYKKYRRKNVNLNMRDEKLHLN